jgi:hypothetical protein
MPIDALLDNVKTTVLVPSTVCNSLSKENTAAACSSSAKAHSATARGH